MKPQQDNSTTRREFIEQMALLGIASMVPLSFLSCGKNASDLDFVGSGLAPFKIWEEILMALETSSDHLEGRMKKLIAAGDPKAMFYFVRDEIYLMPTTEKSLHKMGELMKFGTKGVLRCGFATPREKAELLNQMYNEAGINSKIVYERTNIQVDEVPAFFFRPIQRNFDPKISKKTLKRWEAEMEYKQVENSSAKNVDQDIEQSIALANELWNELPNKDKIIAQSFDFRWDNYSTPTVEFTYQEQTLYAHLFDPKINFGALKNDNGGSVKQADEAVYADQKVTISLNFRDGIDLREEKELVKGEWFAHELSGNQIVINFLHGLSLQEQAYTNIGNLRVFTPALSFQSFDMNAEEMEKKSFLGNPLTLEGRIIDLSKNVAKIGKHPLLINADKNLQKSVQQIEVKAVPNTYPLVKLEVKPTNHQGEFVEGLSAADFAIKDNDGPIAALMERNERAPRILILYDGSLSMPHEYYGENLDRFITQLENSIKEKYSSAIITKWITNSSLYTWLFKASQTDNDLIIYATDGDNDDVFIDDNLNFYKSGPPALVLNVYNSDQKSKMGSFTKMAQVTNGNVFNAKDQALVIASIVEYIDSIEIAPYIFTYYVTDKEANHTAKISVDKERVAATANYKFISFPEYGMPLGQNIAGLYLKIKVGSTEVNRLYAGWDPIINSNRTPTISDFLDVKCHLLGSAVLSFEGEGPTFSNALSDVLKYRLSTRKWGEAVINKEFKKAREALENGNFTSTDAFLPLMAPLSNQVTNDAFTFSAGIRIGILKNKVGLEGATTETNFDYIPTSKYVTFSKNEQDNFKINLTQTAQLAIREKEIYEQSTYQVLNYKKWAERATVVNEEWFAELYQRGDDALFWQEVIYRHDGSFKIIDTTAKTKAFWYINSKTGELYGILPNGTGGGTSSIEQQLKELNRVIDLYMLLFTGLGVASTPIGIVATYGKTLVKLYAIVTEVLIIMDPSGMDEKISEAMKELACNIQKEINFFAMGKVGEIMGGFDTMISLMGGSGLPGTGCN
jgi:hypothetical protein